MSTAPRASMANPWGAQCAGKKRYTSRAEAQAALAHIPRKRGRRPGRIEAYDCGYCGGAHLGHTRR